MPRKTELSPWFARHYQKNKQFYDDIVESCTSLEELILQTDLAGTKWGVHDWSIILAKILGLASMTNFANLLFINTIQHLDKDSPDKEITDIFTNNIIIKSIVTLYQQIESLANEYAKQLTLQTLHIFFAHLFNRWPKLAKMPYMFSTYRKIKRHIILRCYIRSTKNSDGQIMTYISSSPNTLQSSTTTFEQCLSDFIDRHLEKSPGQA